MMCRIDRSTVVVSADTADSLYLNGARETTLYLIIYSEWLKIALRNGVAEGFLG
tara:strand:+ start:239 stop:400 length:162 start_codon:yes stop_codon:yes gene_type:complete